MTTDLFQAAVGRITAGADLGETTQLAGALDAQGRPDLAEQIYRIWLQFNPDDARGFVARFNAAGALSRLGRHAEAQDQLERALAQKPDFLPAAINLGSVLSAQGQPDAAMARWTQVLAALAPVTGQSVGWALATLRMMTKQSLDADRPAAAMALMRQSLELQPDQPDILEQHFGLRLGQCLWPEIEPMERLSRKQQLAGAHPLSMVAYRDDPLLQLALAHAYVERVAPVPPADSDLDRRDAPVAPDGRRLRIGYVSSDLREHAIGYLMVELFETHRRERVEVFAYYSNPRATDPIQDRIRAGAEHWRDITTLSDEAAARQIAADGIDILIDVNGHTREARLGVFALRPAPIQINWLGYPGTMGGGLHDYIIADPVIAPPDHELYLSEEVLRLACYQPNDRKRLVHPETPGRAEAGLPEDGFVFACFNGLHKIRRPVFDRWMEILRQTPGSVLWLLSGDLQAQERLHACADAAGVGRARVIFAPKLASAFHLARYRLADLFLDTAPYGAHTTASDALWMGVPILTQPGLCFASRVCASLAAAAGQPPGLVVDSGEAYVATAVAMACDPGALAPFRQALAAARDTCVLFDTDRLVGELEDLFHTLAERHRRGETPRRAPRNMAAYLDVGLTLEALDAGAPPDPATLHARYQTHLARHDARCALIPDGRLWPAPAAAGGRARKAG